MEGVQSTSSRLLRRCTKTRHMRMHYITVVINDTNLTLIPPLLVAQTARSDYSLTVLCASCVCSNVQDITIGFVDDAGCERVRH
jgi:hypothetical protein